MTPGSPVRVVTSLAAAQRTQAHLRANRYSRRLQPITGRKPRCRGSKLVTTREPAPITTEQHPDAPEFKAAEIGAIAHLYRGDMYRSKIWCTRPNATTNWAG
jgi:hypothetical protein